LKNNVKYTWEQMRQFYYIYSSNEFSNRDSFVRKMKKLKISEEEATVIWQSFDMATEQLWNYIKVIYPVNPIVQ